MPPGGELGPVRPAGRGPGSPAPAVSPARCRLAVSWDRFGREERVLSHRRRADERSHATHRQRSARRQMATLRVLEHDGRPIVHGFGEEEMSSAGRGQLLVPWPNRIRDGEYSFDGRDLQLGLTEPSRHNASHGLVRWAAWTPEEHTGTSVSLSYRLMAQSGYPWTVDLHVLYDLSADGLTVTQTATNLSDRPAPYACGAHPYLTAGAGPVDGWELTLPASRRLLVDERQIPIGDEEVAGTPY